MSKLLIHEPPLQVLPSLAAKIGLNEAIFLQQLHYWLTPSAKYKPQYREFNGQMLPWVYNTDDENSHGTGWVTNFPFWSVRTIKRIRASLKRQGLTIATDEFNASASNRTLWTTIDYEKLAEIEAEISGPLDSANLSPPGDNLSPSRECQVGPLMKETKETTKGEAPLAETAKQRPQAERDALNSIATELAKIAMLDIDTVSGKVRAALQAATLKLANKPNVMAKLEGPYSAWWYANDWRGKMGQPPTPSQIGDTWGQFENDTVGPARSATTLSDAKKARLAELSA